MQLFLFYAVLLQGTANGIIVKDNPANGKELQILPFEAYFYVFLKIF